MTGRAKDDALELGCTTRQQGHHLLLQATVLFLKDAKANDKCIEQMLAIWTFLTARTSGGQSADVRSRLSTETVVHRLFQGVQLLPPKDKVQLLNCVHSLTQSSDLEPISNAGCIRELINVLHYVSEHETVRREEVCVQATA